MKVFGQMDHRLLLRCLEHSGLVLGQDAKLNQLVENVVRRNGDGTGQFDFCSDAGAAVTCTVKLSRYGIRNHIDIWVESGSANIPSLGFLNEYTRNQSQMQADICITDQRVLEEFDKIVHSRGVNVVSLQKSGGALDKDLALSLIHEYENTVDEFIRHMILRCFLPKKIPANTKRLVAGWLIKAFAAKENAILRITIIQALANVVSSENAASVLELIKNPTYGHHRAALCNILAKLKPPRLINELLTLISDPDGEVVSAALLNLGKLRESDVVPKLKQALEHAPKEVQLDIQKIIRKLESKTSQNASFSIEQHPGLPSKVNEEWSANLDAEELEPVLSNLSKLITSGFSAADVEAVLYKVKALEPKQETSFEFHIQYNGNPSILRIEVEMSDEDSPDVAIYGAPDLIKVFEQHAGV